MSEPKGKNVPEPVAMGEGIPVSAREEICVSVVDQYIDRIHNFTFN